MQVFLYGTLLDDVLRARLLGREIATRAATAQGYAVRRQAEDIYPALVADPAATATGIVIGGLTETEIARLDSYELPFGYKADVISVIVDGAPAQARAYVPDGTVPVSDEPWDMQPWRDHVAPVQREMAREIGAYDPPLSGKSLKRQWHMIALRAGVRVRAAASVTPSEVRRSAAPGDVVVQTRKPLAGEFFKFAAFEMDHSTFRGDRSGTLPREVILAADAAIVLPYDPATDHLLLVEQIRVGPLLRGEPNPWLLEPVAGMIDGLETPEQAALREVAEETGLSNVTLEKMFAFYPSPGASTDYFNCYLALADLPEATTYTGGLVDESEDLRLHVLPFDRALALIDTGEVNVGPLIAMLYWLDRQRPRLRAAA